MPLSLDEYKLAAGLNNVAGLVLVTALGSQGIQTPKGIGNYRGGSRRVTSAGTLYNAGYGVVNWRFNYMTATQLIYLKDTFGTAGYSKPVTIRTRTQGLTYANYSAIMTLPDFMDLDQSPLADDSDLAYKDFEIVFTRLVVIP